MGAYRSSGLRRDRITIQSIRRAQSRDVGTTSIVGCSLGYLDERPLEPPCDLVQVIPELVSGVCERSGSAQREIREQDLRLV
jgi:hypothetical protein